jgi:hypothetical protein
VIFGKKSPPSTLSLGLIYCLPLIFSPPRMTIGFISSPGLHLLGSYCHLSLPLPIVGALPQVLPATIASFWWCRALPSRSDLAIDAQPCVIPPSSQTPSFSVLGHRRSPVVPLCYVHARACPPPCHMALGLIFMPQRHRLHVRLQSTIDLAPSKLLALSSSLGHCSFSMDATVLTSSPRHPRYPPLVLVKLALELVAHRT